MSGDNYDKLGPTLLFDTWLRDSGLLNQLNAGELRIAWCLSLRWGDASPAVHPQLFEAGCYVAFPSARGSLPRETGMTRRGCQLAASSLAGKLERTGVVRRREGRLSARSQARGWVWSFDRAAALAALRAPQITSENRNPPQQDLDGRLHRGANAGSPGERSHQGGERLFAGGGERPCAGGANTGAPGAANDCSPEPSLKPHQGPSPTPDRRKPASIEDVERGLEQLRQRGRRRRVPRGTIAAADGRG